MCNFWSNKLGVVLTDNRVVISQNGSVILNTICCVTRLRQTGEIIRAGAVYCIDMAPNGIVSHPVKLGVVCDFEGVSFMLNRYVKEVCHWYHRINLSANFAMRGCLTESEVRALKDCYANKANQVSYMQEIIATILDKDEAIVIYVADDFIEITLLRNYRINRLFVKECTLEELRNSVKEFAFENNIIIEEETIRLIIGSFFGGENIVVHGQHTTSAMPQELSLDIENILSMTSAWFEKIKGYINDFIRECDSKANLYLMSDYDNVNYLTQELSSRCKTKIEPINNALEKITNNLSLR